MAVESVCWHKAEVGGSLARSLACAIAGVAPASEPLDATVAGARHADWLDELLGTISRTAPATPTLPTGGGDGGEQRSSPNGDTAGRQRASWTRPGTNSAGVTVSLPTCQAWQA